MRFVYSTMGAKWKIKHFPNDIPNQPTTRLCLSISVDGKAHAISVHPLHKGRSLAARRSQTYGFSEDGSGSKQYASDQLAMDSDRK